MSANITPKARIEHAATWFRPQENAYREILRVKPLASGDIFTEHRRINVLACEDRPETLQITKHEFRNYPDHSIMPFDLSVGAAHASTSFALFKDIDAAIIQQISRSIADGCFEDIWTVSLRLGLLAHMLLLEQPRLDPQKTAGLAATWFDDPKNWLFAEHTGKPPQPARYRQYYKFGMVFGGEGARMGWQDPVRGPVQQGPFPANLCSCTVTLNPEQATSALWLARLFAGAANKINLSPSEGLPSKTWDDAMSLNFLMALLKDAR